MESVVFDPKRRCDHPPAIGINDPRKRMIDRREDNDPLTRGRACLNDHRNGVDQPMRLQRPVRLNRPAMAARHPGCHRGTKARIVAVIAMDAVIDHLLQRHIDRRRRTEIHISNPERNTGVRRNTVILLEFVPLLGMGVSAVDHLVEINHQLSVPGRCH